MLQLFLIIFISFFSTDIAASKFNMPYGVSTMSHKIYDLHMACLYICTVIAIVVFSILIYSIYHFRKSKGATPAHFHENLLIEIIWTAIPFLILVALAIPATKILADIHNTEKSALTIKITGYQWKWKYEYLDNNISFFSYLSTPWDQVYQQKMPRNEWFLLEVDHPMVIPINTKVKLLITSDDVVHSWWVPDIGVKQDAVPGFINENWVYVTTPGVYRGQCGELCGINHAFMPIVVIAVNPNDFSKWVADNQKTLANVTNLPVMTEEQLLTLGKLEYERNCAMCHQNNGIGLGTSFPPLKGSVVVTSPLDETIAYILHGVPGTPMQSFDKILDNVALASIITYIRHAWGNDQIISTKQYILDAQPADIEKVREVRRANLLSKVGGKTKGETR